MSRNSKMMSRDIQDMFSQVPPTYELVNHILTFGLDIFWRRKAAKTASIGGGKKWLDMCSGTGEMALYLQRLAGSETMVVAADFCFPMLHKAIEKPEGRKILFTFADAKALPFCDETFDRITLSFATRNLSVSGESLTQSLSEFWRILKPEGLFVNLETSQPPIRTIRRIFHLYVRFIVKSLGYFISGSKTGYAYLSQTIRNFYGAEEFAEIIRQAGFQTVCFKRMMFGAAAIHTCTK